MSEIASIHAQVETFVLELDARARRIHDALDHLRHETLLRFRLEPADPAAIERWLADERFAADDDGFFQSQRRLEAFRAGTLAPDAISEFWPVIARDDPRARARLYALREVGPRLRELQQAQPGVAWIYYQDVTNVGLLFPYAEIATVVPASFEVRSYHTFVSIDRAPDDGHAVRWTPPTIDYGGEGLITSASIPVCLGDELVGVWSIDVPLRTIHRDRIHQHVASEQRNFIVDRDGWVVDDESITASLSQERGSLVHRHIKDLGERFGALDLRALARDGAGTLELFDDETGDLLIVVYRVIPEIQWLVFATFPKVKMLAAINAKVMEAFSRIKHGDLSYRIDGDVTAEMQQLVDGCNEMSAAIQADLARREADAAELHAAKTAAEAANVAKDRFLAALSHELRTPLSPVLAAVSLLQQDPRYAHTLEGPLGMIRRNVEIEAHLIDDLLDIDAITRGTVRLERRVIDVHEVIARACETCAPDLASRRVGVETQLDTIHHHVDGDPARLQQALWNLLRNAAKFSDPGESIRVHAFNPSPHRLRIEITDSGVGLRAGDQERIFEAFEQVGATTRGGLGIGLTIAKAVVEAHGGTIDVHSRGPGEGATFGIELATTVPLPAPAPAPALATAQTPPPRPQPLRVLLVEDNPDMSEVLVLALETRGHIVTAAASGGEGLRHARAERFDLLISDLGLPDMSGYELVRQMHDRSDEPPAIAVSGYGRPEDIRKSVEAGFLRHLTKPIEIGQLDAAIKEVAGGSR